MARRNAPFEIEQIEQLALIARLPTHHGKPPPLNVSSDGITVRRKSRALFQQYRSKPVRLAVSTCFPLDPGEFNRSVQHQLQSIGRGFEGQGLSRALIELQSNGIEVGLGEA